MEHSPSGVARVQRPASESALLRTALFMYLMALVVLVQAQCNFPPFQERWVACYHSTMAVTGNGLYVWGDAMGANGTTDLFSPVQVIPANGYNYTGTPRLFTQGDGFEGDDPQSFLLTTTGLYVWGYENNVINTSATTSTTFQATTLPAGVAPTDVSYMTACYGILALLTNNGNVYVRASGSAALLGDGSGTNNGAWHQATISNVTHLKAVRYGIFAVTSSNTWYTWGPMTCLGNGAGEVSRNTPTVMTAPFAGTPAMIALTNDPNGVSYYALNPADGKIYVLGENANGRLGTGNTTDRTTWGLVRNPTNTADLTNVTFINAVDNSPQHNSACAITSDSTVYFWGQNDGNMLSSAAATPSQLLPIVPAGFTQGVDKAVYAHMSGHYSLVHKRGLQRPCFVGHRQEGNVGDGSAADNYITSLNCVIIPDIDFCISLASPVARDDGYTTAQDVAVSGQTLAINDNDADNTNAQLTWSLVSGGTATSNGELTVNANGTFSWTPEAGYWGTVNFTYQACDPAMLCDPALVTINVYSTLPVELVNFAGRNAGTVNQLSWSTASEQNNDRFEVERSPDASEFERIGILPGGGNSQQERRYAWDDVYPLHGANYYRLKQVDSDGTSSYSPMVAVMVAQREAYCEVQLIDPAGLYVLHCGQKEGAFAELMNAYGQTVRGVTALSNGRYQVDLRGLPAAAYVVRFQEGDQVRTYKLMKP